MDIAVTGIGCRFPGDANDAVSFWQLLVNGVDAIVDVPRERWHHEQFYHPDGPDRKTPQAQGGFIRHMDRFDAAFFGISPREASTLDPQQRMLLEVAWEALEDAGYPLEKVAGTRMGVFTGGSIHDYADLQDIDSLTTHSITGWNLCMVANRLSYAFDLQGPSLTVDTACSSALVALNDAVRSMRTGECDTALVCGVNSLLNPMQFIAFSQLSMLSPTSRCHAFDESADGFVRAEGAGVVVLKPLEKALADGDRVYAVVKSTAVNSDGRNEGLTVPNGDAQIRLLVAAYAGLPIENVRYVEAHGTGTQVGDPVEARAIGTALQHAGRRLLVGSVKTNIGHLEAGAGMAGFIKAALVAYHRTVPPNLHFKRPNPKIPFQAYGIEIPTTAVPLPDGECLVGVNSFGFGGTNAHAVLQAACLPAPPLRPARLAAPGLDSVRMPAQSDHALQATPQPHLICISARSEGALQALKTRYAGLADPLESVAYSALTRRTPMPYRLAAVVGSLSELHTAPPSPPVRHKPRIGFVYSGQGSQWVGMGRTLLSDKTFADVMDLCEPHVQAEAGWSLRQTLQDDAVDIDRTRMTQPLIFAIQAGLTQLLKAWGITPEVVLGHSVGEVAAAWASGALSLKDAIRLVVHRGRVMDCDGSRGRMLAVQAGPEAVAPYLSDGVCVGAINAPTSITLSGTAAGIDAVRRRLKDGGFECTDVRVEYAFHSPQLDGLKPELEHALQGLTAAKPSTLLISTVTGQPVEDVGVSYWWRNVREPVRFADAVKTAVAQGIDVLVEVGGHPVLGPSIVECGGKTVPTLRRQKPEAQAASATASSSGPGLAEAPRSAATSAPTPSVPGPGPAGLAAVPGSAATSAHAGPAGLAERRAVLDTLAELFRLGAPVRWGDATAPAWVPLPLYPWQKESYWRESSRSHQLRLSPSSYALLGLPQARNVWMTSLAPDSPPWLADHLLHQEVLLSASSIIETGLEAAHARTPAFPLVLEDVRIEAACFVGPDTKLQTVLGSDGAFSLMAHTDDWRGVASGRVGTDSGSTPGVVDIQALAAGLPHRWEGSLKGPFEARGLQFGPTFDAMRRGFSHPGVESVGQIVGPATLPVHDGVSLTHPGSIDSGLQVLLEAADQKLMGDGVTWIPVRIRRVRLLRPMAGEVWVHARVRFQTRRALEVDLSFYSPDGHLVMDVIGYHNVRTTERDASEAIDRLTYTMQWVAEAVGERADRSGSVLVFSDGGPLSSTLTTRLEAHGLEAHVVGPGEKFDLRDVSPLGMCVHLHSLNATLEDPPAPLLPLLQVLQQAEEHDLPVPRLWAISRQTQPAGPLAPMGPGGRLATAIRPEGAPLWGLVRVLATEEPFLSPTLIDIEDETTDADAVFNELFSAQAEEVAFRNGQRYVHRCVRRPLTEQPLANVGTGRGYVLTCENAGTLDALRWMTLAERPLGPDDVRVAVAAAGLNFSDVMRVLGLYPTDGPLGTELSGRVVEVGSSVTEFQPGDRVMGLSPAAFASEVVLNRRAIVHTPERLSDVEAAALPLAFATVYHALLDTGHLKKGERILIHAATGGVGQAAVQVARAVGADIFATAGSDEKRKYLKDQGIQHVFDSRSTSFTEGILDATNGEGVDVILNSLAGDAIPRGLAVLKRFGRFLDLTKRDIYNDAPVGLSPFRRSLSYSAIDLEQVMQHAPDVVQRLMAKLRDDVEAGMVGPRQAAPPALAQMGLDVRTGGATPDTQRSVVFPIQTWSYHQAAEAFRCMSQAKHLGKIVLTAEAPAVVERASTPLTPGTWVVTGGLGGFGREVVRWLLDHGAHRVAILSRSPDAHDGFTDARVTLHAVDVGDAQAVTALCESLRPVHGVVHAAMHLDDVPTLKLTRERLQKVFHAKIHGAWNLHQATLSHPVNAFVMFSSNATLFGAGGQGNYAASNAFLDSLAHYRRTVGKPALAVNWGPIGDVGYLARNPQVRQMLESNGSACITSAQAMAALERLLRTDLAQLAVMGADWEKLGQGPLRNAPRFAALASVAEPGHAAAGAGDRRATVQSMLVSQLARVLGTTAEALDPRRPVFDMGLDSLMSLQLRNWAKTTLNLTITASMLLEAPSVEELVDLLLVAPEAKAETPVAVLDQLDDDQIDEFLATLLLVDGSIE